MLTGKRISDISISLRVIINLLTVSVPCVITFTLAAHRYDMKQIEGFSEMRTTVEKVVQSQILRDTIYCMRFSKIESDLDHNRRLIEEYERK